MSTGAECYFTEVEPGRYTYWLQDWPYGDNPDGQTYGPFGSFKAASDHLHDNHANPGGYSVNTLPEGKHRHEWVKGSGQVVTGVTVEITVQSLGPDATPEQVIDFVKTLNTDHPAFKTRPSYGWRDDVVRCDACGQAPS